jgi:S-adenosylmethionine hydrolase
MPKVTRHKGEIDGEIIYVDGFGNLFTNVEERDLTGLPMARLAVTLASSEVRGLATSYAMVSAGDFVAVINSWGLLEVSAYKGSAQRLLSAKIGDRVRVRWDD